MEKSNKRGKIPQSDWPLIMARYEAGETLASIARTYDCSPPAISYVVSRSRTRHPSGAGPAEAPSNAEPQLIKGGASGPPAEVRSGRPQAPAVSPPVAPAGNGGSDSPVSAPDQPVEATSAGPDEAAAKSRVSPGENPPSNDAANPVAGRGHPPREVAGSGDVADRTARSPGAPVNGAYPSAAPAAAAPAGGSRLAETAQRSIPPAPAPAPAPTNGIDQRRKLHLSLGNAGPAAGVQRPPELPSGARPEAALHNRLVQANPAVPNAAQGGGAEGVAEIRPVFEEPERKNGNDAASRTTAGNSFIDRELRARVDTDIGVFLAAFDAALVQDTQESRSALREATDRLLRVGARTRIELERLEARQPLPPRDRSGGNEVAAWRYR